MKIINKFLLALFVPLTISCSKDDDNNEPQVLPVTVDFPADLSVPEFSEAQQITISFDRPAPVAGSIFIEVTPSDAIGFTTAPAIVDGEIEIEVARGATGASFTFESENDDRLQGNRTIEFLLLENSDDFLVGTKDRFSLTIFEDEVAAIAGFSWPSYEIMENQTEELEIKIDFSVPVPGEATVKVKVEGDGVEDFLATIPPMDTNNIIDLPVPSGVWNVGIGLRPNNNATFDQHKILKFSIIEVSGPITRGDRLNLDLKVKDDELLGKLQSVEIINGNNTLLKTLEYGTNGRISKVLIEENASGYSLPQNYHYDENGRLTSLSGTTGDGEYLTWENGEIVKREKMTGFFGINQSFFEYENGKLSGRRDFVLDGNRNATETDRITYSYHSSGNLKTAVHSSLVEGAWKEISIRTYDAYGQITHPFPLEAGPGLPLQQHLNGTLTIKQNNEIRSLYYANTFDADGKLLSRHNGQEIINYSYY